MIFEVLQSASIASHEQQRSKVGICDDRADQGEPHNVGRSKIEVFL
jgi:hypothetical protein